MRFKLLAACALSFALAGCGELGLGGAEATVDAPMVAAAMDAYRSGDYAAFKTALDAFEAAHPKPSGERPDPCSPEGYAQRRAAQMRAQLDTLDQRRVFYMSDEARLSYFDVAFMGGGPIGDASGIANVDASSLCRDTPDAVLLGLKDHAEFAAVLTAYTANRKAWWDELEGKFGANMLPRMQRAGELLKRNRLEASHLIQPAEDKRSPEERWKDQLAEQS